MSSWRGAGQDGRFGLDPRNSIKSEASIVSRSDGRELFGAAVAALGPGAGGSGALVSVIKDASGISVVGGFRRF